MTEVVHHGVRIPYDSREDLAAHEEPEHRSEESSASRIEHVLSDYLAVAVAERFQHTYLCALLVHHPGHRGHAYEGRDQEEEEREYLRDVAHDARIAVERSVARVLLARDGEGVADLHVVYLLLGFIEFILGVIELPLCLFELAVGFSFLSFKSLLALAEIGLLFIEFIESVLCAGDAALDLGQPVFGLFLAFLCLGKPVFDLSEFLLKFFDLFVDRCDLRLCPRELLARFFYLSFVCLSVFRVFFKRCLQALQLLLEPLLRFDELLSARLCLRDPILQLRFVLLQFAYRLIEI